MPPYRLGIISFTLALLLSACPGENPNYCNCPNLTEATSSIDWIGDGTAATRVSASGGSNHQVVLDFEVVDSAAIQQLVEDRLRSFPSAFRTVADHHGSGTFSGDGWSVYVGGVDTGDSTLLTIFFETSADEADVAEVLAPIAELLGTINRDDIPTAEDLTW